MKGRHKYFRNGKPIAQVAIGFVLATLSCKLDVTTQGCNLLDKAAWVALEVLGPVILAAFQSVPDCLCHASRVLQHVLQIVASVWPVLCVIASKSHSEPTYLLNARRSQTLNKYLQKSYRSCRFPYPSFDA
jgi:hypothetical protein